MNVEFFFDPVSPYSWLASTEIADIETTSGVAVHAVPVLFAGLLAAHGQKGPAEIPAKRAYTFRDVMRRAAGRGLTFRGPPTHPFNPLKALRMATAIDDPVSRTRYAIALLDAVWAHGEDATVEAVLLRVADRAGLDGGPLLGASSDSAVKHALRTRTDEAARAGIFGVPTFRLENELFWGADRIEDLRKRIAGTGPLIDEMLLEKVLARSASAERRG